ncbi:hypothetical protein LOTGIDRAFT_162923 [Lottia gigantea]|uniref:JmjC domain-containing protein n=1 Tax=Lottia gigantea TaxID=225164 RepID=V4AFU6_LOTGI|nr:hypothetical protein LOTGIDRAFT_162923 [Lottia gigantea]ESO92271.1 hypothetical protein LOTGIDRAFT_162923 [Lottia gigantea]
MDYVKYPGLAEVEYIHAHLESGDCLYIPYKWIHQVRSYNSNLAVNIWWSHYDSLKTNLSTCNKECDKELTLGKVKTTGFNALLESVENIKDHFVSSLETAKGQTLSKSDFLNSLFPVRTIVQSISSRCQDNPSEREKNNAQCRNQLIPPD